jgi:PAS domain S-box-containing protein
MSKPGIVKTARPKNYSTDLSRPDLIVLITLAFTVALSLVDLIGWISGIKPLTSILHEWEAMKIITAICLILGAGALAIIHFNLLHFTGKLIIRVLAGFIFIAGLTSLYVHIYALLSGKQSLLTGAYLLSWFTGPENRMAFMTAASFSLLGVIILIIVSDWKNIWGIVHSLIIPVILTNYFTISSYILNVHYASSINGVTVALNTSFAFCSLSIAVLAMNRNSWLVNVFASGNMGGVIARTLIPAATIVPVIIGWLRIRSEHTGLFVSEQGVVLVALTYTVFFLILAWFVARSVTSLDMKRRISEEALRVSSEQLAAIFNGVPETLMLVDIEGTIIAGNKTALNRFNQGKPGFVGKNINDFVPVLNNKRRKEQIFAMTLTKQPIKFQDKIGDVILDMIFYPVLSPEGNVVQYIIFATDITESKKIQDALRISEQRLKYHLENSPLAVVEWDKDYNVTQWTQEGERIFGWKKEEVLGKNIGSLNMIYAEDIPIVAKTMERLSGGKEPKVVSSNRNNTKSGDVRECIWYNSVLLDETGRMSSVMSLIEDVTERRKTEKDVIERTKELELSNINLQKELTERILAQEALKKNELELIELNTTKDKFFNIVAHDLKNPFTSLIGSSELLYANIESLDTQSIKKLATILNDSAKGGYSILQNLLDWSRSQTGMLKISLQEINLRHVIEENLTNLQLQADNKKINIMSEVTVDINIVTDKNMINTVLRNLLSNAVKFTRKYGKVVVSARLEPSEVTIIVKDNGVGIPEEKLGKLFSLETKNSTPGTENEQGTGLGLKLSSEFAEKLGGRIRVESIENEGSEFSFMIPANHLSGNIDKQNCS